MTEDKGTKEEKYYLDVVNIDRYDMILGDKKTNREAKKHPLGDCKWVSVILGDNTVPFA